MSRLEQMREHFLQRVHIQQKQQQQKQHQNVHTHLPRLIITSAQPIHNILNKRPHKQWPPAQSQLQRSPSGFELTHCRADWATRTALGHGKISRVKSLNNVCTDSKEGGIVTVSTGNTVKSKSEENKRNSTPNVNKNRTSANSTKVNKQQQQQPFRKNGPHGGNQVVDKHKGVTVSETTANSRQKVTTAVVNSNDNNLQCKHCERKFAARERLDKHSDICAQMRTKQRPVFNSTKQRLREHLMANETSDQGEHLVKLQQTTASSMVPDKTSGDMLELSNNDVTTSTQKVHWKKARQQMLNAIAQARKQMTHPQNNSNGDDVDDDNVMYNLHHLSTNSESVAVIGINENCENLLFSQCSYCKRKFNSNVIIKHETICGKLYRKKHFEGFFENK